VYWKRRTLNFFDGLEDFLDTVVTVQTDFDFHHLLMTHKKNKTSHIGLWLSWKQKKDVQWLALTLAILIVKFLILYDDF